MSIVRQDLVITVNEKNEWTGTMEKLLAHQRGILHRAFSVFVLNSNGNMLLQRRAAEKYHSGGLWTNTCCSHPAPGESTFAAAHRRLKEEMGFDCEVSPIFDLRYKADVGNGLIENEYDHIYLGRYDGHPSVNPEEVMDYKYLPLEDIAQWLEQSPGDFTEWFRLAFPTFVSNVKDTAIVPA